MNNITFFLSIVIFFNVGNVWKCSLVNSKFLCMEYGSGLWFIRGPLLFIWAAISIFQSLKLEAVWNLGFIFDSRKDPRCDWNIIYSESRFSTIWLKDAGYLRNYFHNWMWIPSIFYVKPPLTAASHHYFDILYQIIVIICLGNLTPTDSRINSWSKPAISISTRLIHHPGTGGKKQGEGLAVMKLWYLSQSHRFLPVNLIKCIGTNNW